MFQSIEFRNMTHLRAVLLPLFIALVMFVGACSDEDNPVDPAPSSLDTLSITNVNDDVDILVKATDFTGSQTSFVRFFGTGLASHSIELEADSITKGSIAISLVNSSEVVWQHTCTTDSTTWKVSGETGSPYSGIRVQGVSASGRIRIKTERR